LAAVETKSMDVAQTVDPSEARPVRTRPAQLLTSLPGRPALPRDVNAVDGAGHRAEPAKTFA
jgi:hypothetical protein